VQVILKAFGCAERAVQYLDMKAVWWNDRCLFWGSNEVSALWAIHTVFFELKCVVYILITVF